MCNRFFLLITLLIGGQVFISCYTEPEIEEISSSSGVKGASSSSNLGGVSSSSSIGGLSSSYSSSSSTVGTSSSSTNQSASSSSLAGGTSSSSSNQGTSGTPSSSSETIPVGCPNAPPLNGYKPGTDLYDNRNSKTYKTVIIGTQTWMAENLNYNYGTTTKCYAQGSEDANATPLLVTPTEAEANCDKFGRLYDWATAGAVCPQGWHLPDTTDWEKLKEFVQDEIFCNYEDEDNGWDVGTKLKSSENWNIYEGSTKGVVGVDTYGFKAIGSGFCQFCNRLGDNTGYYSGGPTLKNPGGSNGRAAHWWSATENGNNTSEAFKYNVTYDKKEMTRGRESKEEYLYSVRCVKD